MLKLIKYLKPFAVSIIVIIILLFVQATCNLSLPDYMSNIVNVGIQQSGIENAVPDVIRKNEFDKLLLFMSESDKNIVKNDYILLDKQNLNNTDLNNYLKDYPLLDKEAIYKLDTSDKDEINKLNLILGKPILIVSGIEKNDFKAPSMNIPKNVDTFMLLSKMPKEKLKAMKENINKKFENMPDTMITQAAVNYIKDEYKSIGIDVDKLQLKYVLVSGLKMILLALLSMIAAVVVGFFASRVAAGLGRNLRKQVFRRVVNFSNSEFDKFSTASLITRSTNDIQQVQRLFVFLLRIAFYAPILGIGGIIKVLNTDTTMGWIIVLAVGSIFLLVGVMFGIAIPKFKSIQKLVDKLNLVTRESLIGILVIRAFNNQKYELKKFDIANTNLTKTNLFINRIMVMMMPMMMLIMNLIMILIVWVGSHQVDAGSMQVGNMMAFMQYTMQIIMAFLMISLVSIMLPRASVSAQRICEVIDTDITIKDPESPQSFNKNIDEKGKIEFKNVSFRYPGAEEDVLSDISFVAEAGKTTAFIGSTGSGKSTLINLIPRFYDVTSGQILVDGIDIRNVTQNALREKIGYVPQKGVLFSGTIESNLKYGNEEATQNEVIKAAEIAQAMEFIDDKPEGFNTEISQGGTNVSGGQKQRLSIARALVKRPEIFIFDDSFSALDFKTDSELRKALKREIKESTVLIVAQRISTIKNADQIIVLDEGKIVGKGTHSELMKNCDVYRQIALSQLSKGEIAS
ncbi:putative ABC transporter ATP-binding protein [Clostridium tepidiprofundi DSM 19306]|uniref:Putative ABC transporter ATP-binding protein n=1 Tax=Clostridium tepidiprofundi DSM 19306 TaxID=1121338 RepID=A0A151ASK5_9CLOT|nr:ABC transporter ATP-binding protein [Clostridium tepidiprofundi]KYH30595.1 putative ABC transporter ATP-binding protein [Clostridium tepidiprofundi DSM 19306]